MTQSRYQEEEWIQILVHQWRWMKSWESPNLLLLQNHKETVSSNIADFLNRVCTEDKSTPKWQITKKEGRMSPIFPQALICIIQKPQAKINERASPSILEDSLR